MQQVLVGTWPLLTFTSHPKATTHLANTKMEQSAKPDDFNSVLAGVALKRASMGKTEQRQWKTDDEEGPAEEQYRSVEEILAKKSAPAAPEEMLSPVKTPGSVASEKVTPHLFSHHDESPAVRQPTVSSHQRLSQRLEKFFKQDEMQEKCENVDISKLVMYYEHDIDKLNEYLREEYGSDLQCISEDATVSEPTEAAAAQPPSRDSVKYKRMSICGDHPATWDEHLHDEHPDSSDSKAQTISLGQVCFVVYI